MEKHIEKEIARKRRAKMLLAWNRFTGTKRKFAERYKLTPERIGQILKIAEKEKNVSL